MNAISVENLFKSYGGIEAVKGISFDVPEGSFFAFLGPNGAGKSTVIGILSSLIACDSGTARLFGSDPMDSKRDIGVVFQDSKLDPRLTVRENISVRGALYGLYGKQLKDAVENSISDTGCGEFADRRYGELSGGQRRRADIARALVHRPRLLILDEPTTGLDPMTRKQVWSLIDMLNERDGITVLLTTHYMEEAEGADDIVVIKKGEIVARGTPEKLRDEWCSDSMTVATSDPASAGSILDRMGVPYSVERGVFTIKLSSTADAVPVATALGGLVTSMEVRSGTLDEAFIGITEECE